MKIILKTERLLLRPFEINDAEEMFHQWANDIEVTKYLTWNPHKSIDDTKAILSTWIKEYEKIERINFAITLLDTGKLIGQIDVVGYINGIPIIGYVLSRKYWNNGYMTEACNKVIEYIYSLGYENIRIDAVNENIASNMVIKKCGGKYIDTIEQFFPLKEKNFIINRYIIKKDNLISKI